MASAESRYSISKLNGTNYFVWKYKMEMLLKEKGLWADINEVQPSPVTAAWTANDEKAHSTIALNVEDDQIHHIIGADSARNTWRILKETYESNTSSNRVHILKLIMQQRLDEGGDAEKHVNSMNELFRKLLALGADFGPEFFMSATLLASLPPSYDGLVTALEGKEESELTLTLVKSKVLAEFKRRMDRGGTTDDTALKVDTSRATKGQKGENKKFECYFCKRSGHIKKDCRKYKAWLNKKEGSNQKANLAKDETEKLFVTHQVGDGWIVDSGATCHIASSKDIFVNIDMNCSDKVSVASGQQLTAAGKGTIKVDFLNEENQSVPVRITDVLLMPDIKGNLLSVKKLTEKGFQVNFKGNKCEIRENSRQIAVGEISGKLYRLKEPHKVYSVEKESNGCIHYWHKVLGHRDIKVVKSLAKRNLVKGINFSECTADCEINSKCRVCLEGKITRIKFPVKSSNKAVAVMDLIHSDVCGPMQTTTPSGNRYIVTFIDDYSKFTVSYLIANKSSVYSKFKEYIAMVKVQFGKKPKCIRTDRGGEYISNEFVNYLKSSGIQIQRTTAYTPQQNGTAERKNRTLVEMAHCMLIDAGLEKKFWGEAVMMANYVQNRLPTKGTETTPYEGWFQKSPNVQYFRKFGSECYMHVPKQTRRKFDSKGVKAVLVGYDYESKAYRCYSPETDRVTVSRDVQFVERGHLLPIKSSEDYQQEQIIDNSELNNFEDAENDQVQKELVDEEVQEENPIQDHVQNEDKEQTVRRSQRANKGIPPKKLIEEMNVVSSVIQEPKCYVEAIKGDQKRLWIQAMTDEMKSLMENQTWELVKIPEGANLVGCKWIYKLKCNSDGKVVRHKARLVAQGFSQKYGTDYDQVFAPVVRQTTFRTLLTVAANKDMKVYHLDAKTAFLNSELSETIYMRQPPGFKVEGGEDLVCLLKRSLYGLKQSARNWNKTIHQILIDFGFVQSKNDPCLYTYKHDGKICYVLIYVDDVVIAGENNEIISKCETFLSSKFKIKNLGEIKDFLSLQVKKEADGYYTLNQTAYIGKLLKDFQMSDAKESSVPLSLGYGKGGDTDLLLGNGKYQKLLGCLLYISVNTRPDISAAVSILAQKMSSPNQEDWNELKRVLKYLKGTAGLQLSLGKSDGTDQLIGYADASWADDRASRKSQSGYIFKYCNGILSWFS